MSASRVVLWRHGQTDMNLTGRIQGARDFPLNEAGLRQAREAAVTALAQVVGGSRGHRDDFALWGYLGFLDDACLRWVHAGCPDDQRHSLVDAALGCLEGALGDWRK